MVRNEADIVEAFVRHNLTLVDRLAVIDHGSFDGTSDILAALMQEGLPLTVQRDERVGFFQSEVMTQAARDLLRRDDADFVVMLDADEFIRAPSRAALKQTLARLPGGAHALAPWLTYIPDFERSPPGDLLALLRSARQAPVVGRTQRKVVVSRCLLETPAAVVSMGNHRVRPSADAPHGPCPHALLPQELLALAHVPIRSADQLTAKIAIGWLAHLATRPSDPAEGFHWREAFAVLAAGGQFSAGDLKAMAAHYGIPRTEWAPTDPAKWTDAPFLADVTLRYTPPGQSSAFRTLLVFAEQLARR